MDASEQFAFPTPQPNDTAEVRAAIERANLLWKEDPKESLRCLREAAESASDAGDDMRSVQLARASADLRNLANISPSAPPPASLPPVTTPSEGAVQLNRSEERHTEPGNFPAFGGSPEEGDAGSAPDASVQTGDRESNEPITTTGAPSFDQGQDEEGAEVSDEDLEPGSAARSAGTKADADTTPRTPSVVHESADSSLGTGNDDTASGSVAPEPLGVAPMGMSLPQSMPEDDQDEGGPSPRQVAAMVPRMAPGKDPAQTVPATPAASAAAAALASAPASYQPLSAGAGMMPPGPSMAHGMGMNQPGMHQGPGMNQPGMHQGGANASARPAAEGNASPGGGSLAARLANAFGARRQAPATLGADASGQPPPRAEQPTLLGRPQSRVNDQTPAATPAAMHAESSPPPSMTSRFVQHRAIAVAISTTPNSSGHFDLHPLAEGERVEPGFRAALLVGLTPGERIFPGRE